MGWRPRTKWACLSLNLRCSGVRWQRRSVDGPNNKVTHVQRLRVEQMAVQMTGHAVAVVADVRRHAELLPAHNGWRALADVVLGEAVQLLSAPLEAPSPV
jgi:hypothetical protein